MDTLFPILNHKEKEKSVFFFVIKIGVKEGKGSGESKHASEAVDVKYRII